MKSERWRFITVAALLVTTLAASQIADRRVPDFLAAPLESIPQNIAGWTKVGAEVFDTRVLQLLQPTSYIANSYQRGNQQLSLSVVYYGEQRAGESMHSPKHCLPGSGWEIWKQDSAWIPVNGETVRVNKYHIQNGNNRMIVFYWYQSRGRIIASEYFGKLLLVRDALLDGRTAASIVRITLADQPGAEQDGVDFAAHLIPEVQRCFGDRQAAVTVRLP